MSVSCQRIPDQVKQKLDASRVLETADRPLNLLMHEPIIEHAGGYKIDEGTMTIRYGWKAIVEALSFASSDILAIQFFLLQSKLTMLISVL